MAKNKDSKITLANIIAIIALAALAVLTFLGYSFYSGGEQIGNVALISVAIVLGNALLLFILIKLKTAENDLRKFRVAEYIFLAVFIAYSCYFGKYPYHFIDITANKHEIQSAASRDFDTIKQLFTDYENDVSKHLNTLATELANSNGLGARQSEELTDYLNKQPDYIRIQRNKLNDNNYKDKKAQFTKTLDDYNSQIKNWNLLKIATLPQNTIKTTEEIQEYIFKHQGNGIMEIKKNLGTGEYEIVQSNYKFDSKTIITDKNGKKKCNIHFIDKLQYDHNPSAVSILITALIYLLILFNYFVAYRTNVTHNRKQDDDGGIILNN